MDTVTPTVCAACHSTHIHYVEEVDEYRIVHGLDAHGVLLIDSAVLGGSGCSEGDNSRLSCHNCGEEWALPQDIDFV